MTETLPRLLLRLSEAGDPAILWGRQAAAHAGVKFERLLNRGVLVEQTPATDWDACSACDCGLDSRPIEWINGCPVAVCPINRRHDSALDVEDLRSFRINLRMLVREISVATGLDDEPSMIAPGVWQLGITPSKRMVFVALSRPSLLQAGLFPTMRSVAKSFPVSLVGPPIPAAEQEQFEAAGVHCAAFDDVIALSESNSSFALRVADLTPAYAAQPRLILIKAKQTIALDGHEMTLPPRSFDLLWLLSEVITGGGGVVTRRQIEQRLWGSQIVSKKAAADAIRDLRQQLAATPGGLRREELIETRHAKGYMLALPAPAIQLIA
jgi:DNA-binding winged helix-turn-helix (wHTH) protein